MFVTCPSCATRYAVDKNALSDSGRMLRCAHCGFTWWHQPHGAPDPQHVQAQTMAQQPVAAEPVRAAVPQPAPRPAPIPEPEPEPEPEPIPEPEPEPVYEPEEDIEEPAVEEPDLTEDEIKRAFGDEEPEPIESMTDAPLEDRGTDEDDSEVNPDSIPDPDPLPESLTSPDDDDFEDEEEEGKSRLGLVLAAVGGGLVLVLLAVFILMSKQIASWVPEMAAVYDTIGLNTVTLGEGLEIQNIKSERISGKDSESLIVRGFIRNTTREKISVPMIKVALYNAENKEVQAVMVSPRTAHIDAGQSLGFRAQIDDPAASARRFEVTFTEAKAAPQGAPQAAPGAPSAGEPKQEQPAPEK